MILQDNPNYINAKVANILEIDLNVTGITILRRLKRPGASLFTMKRGAMSAMPRPSIGKRTKKDSFWTDEIKPEYYFESGLRKVKPYYFEYRTFTKARWYGRTILDVFQREFRDRPSAYYEQAVNHKLITVDGKAVSTDFILGPAQVVCHRIHRHEPPITGSSIKILHKCEGMLVVDKPASVPVHPSGRYRFNTLTEILKTEHGFGHVSIINRLDRLTSGIVLLGLDPDTAQSLHRRMEERAYRKAYICRVIGEFPEGEAICKAPLLAVEHKLGLVAVSSEGKESETKFTRLKYSAELDESIVKAEPLTGRQHQIRVHLLKLGHPIVNDHLYSNQIWARFPPDPETGMRSPGQLREIADELLKTTFFDEVKQQVEEDSHSNDPTANLNSLCPECEVVKDDPDPEQLCIYLHALRYSCDEFNYETNPPNWSDI